MYLLEDKPAPLGVLTIFRDEEPNLSRFFGLLESLETQKYWNGLVCSFYENDSADSTAELLQSWIQDRPGFFISENFGESRHRVFSKDTSRTLRLADARNKALQPLLGSSCRWLLVIDADLHVSPSQVFSLYALKQRYSSASMVCASSLQNVPDVCGESSQSYYDSWALLDFDGTGGITFALNPFHRLTDRWRWMAGLPVSVSSAFGGMALLDMDVVRQYQLRWDGRDGCEHWSFCALARMAGPVLACPTVNPLVLHPDPVPKWTSAYAQQVSAYLSSLKAPSTLQ